MPLTERTKQTMALMRYSRIVERKLYLDDVAEMAGISPAAVRKYRSAARLPDPDGADSEKGHARPWWWESTVKEWMSGRPGSGWWGDHSRRYVLRDTPGLQDRS